jgi:hypothetical protein
MVFAVACLAQTPATSGGGPKTDQPKSDSAKSVPLRGILTQDAGKPPALVLPDHRRVELEGDEPTMGVLNDVRLKGSDFEVAGHFVSPDRFKVNGIETPSLFAYKDGKRLMVSYWCNVCYIRTYTPGKCWCCQKYTDLDLIDPSSN